MEGDGLMAKYESMADASKEAREHAARRLRELANTIENSPERVLSVRSDWGTNYPDSPVVTHTIQVELIWLKELPF